MSEVAKTRISQLPLYTGTSIPATGLFPMSFGGVTYHVPGNKFPEGGEGGGANQIFTGSTVPEDDPGVVPAFYYYIVGDVSDPEPSSTLGEFIVYMWDGVSWKAQWGYSWSDQVAWDLYIPKVRFQRHFQVNEPGGTTGFWSVGQEIAAGLTADSWVYS